MPDHAWNAGVAVARSDRTLREWRDADRAPFAAMNADPQVMEHFPALMSVEDSDAFVARITSQFAEHRYGLWAIEVRETVEEPVISKRARVVEEVRVSKDVTEHDETVRGIKTFARGWHFELLADGTLVVRTPSGVSRVTRPPGWTWDPEPEPPWLEEEVPPDRLLC